MSTSLSVCLPLVFFRGLSSQPGFADRVVALFYSFQQLTPSFEVNLLFESSSASHNTSSPSFAQGLPQVVRVVCISPSVVALLFSFSKLSPSPELMFFMLSPCGSLRCLYLQFVPHLSSLTSSSASRFVVSDGSIQFVCSVAFSTTLIGLAPIQIVSSCRPGLSLLAGCSHFSFCPTGCV